MPDEKNENKALEKGIVEYCVADTVTNMMNTLFQRLDGKRPLKSPTSPSAYSAAIRVTDIVKFSKLIEKECDLQASLKLGLQLTT